MAIKEVRFLVPEGRTSSDLHAAGMVANWNWQGEYPRKGPVPHREEWRTNERRACSITLVADHVMKLAYVLVAGENPAKPEHFVTKIGGCLPAESVLVHAVAATTDEELMWACRALALVGPRTFNAQAFGVLSRALGHADPLVRWTALLAYGYLVWAEFNPIIDRLAGNDPDDTVREAARLTVASRSSPSRRAPEDPAAPTKGVVARSPAASRRKSRAPDGGGRTTASRAARQQIGDAGGWKNTTMGVGTKSTLYTAEADGKLYATSTRTGGRNEIGNGHDVRHLAIDGNRLYAIDADGSLYKVGVKSGKWARLGKPGDSKDALPNLPHWGPPPKSARLDDAGDLKGASAAVALNGYLYTVSGYVLTMTDLEDGSWELLDRVDASDGWKTRFLFVDSHTLYALEDDGSLYSVDTDDGSHELIGDAGDWKNARTVATLDGHLYSVEESGVLYKTDLSTGRREEIGSAQDFGHTQLLFGTGNAVYSIEHDGNLYKIDV